jgi:hypothetical protein
MYHIDFTFCIKAGVVWQQKEEKDDPEAEGSIKAD